MKTQQADKKYIDPVGKSVPRIDGLGMVTGQTKYAFDVSFPNMLVGKMLRSPHPHAKIISIDTSKAEAKGTFVTLWRAATKQVPFVGPLAQQSIASEQLVSLRGAHPIRA